MFGVLVGDKEFLNLKLHMVQEIEYTLHVMNLHLGEEALFLFH